MIAGTGGTVTPSSGSYPNGGTLQITATPAPGHVFGSWTGSGPGSYTGTANPATITVNGNITQTAVLQATVPITITTSPPGKRIGADGVDYVSPRTFDWLSGSLHQVNVDSIVSGGPGGRRGSRSGAMDTPRWRATS
jgi:hypothetical protein